MNGLSGFALAGYLNDLEREKKKAYGAVDTLNRESAASDQYQGARNRTNDWLSSLSPEDLAKLNPEVRNLSSNFEGVGDVSRFDTTKRANELGLTSEFAGVDGIEDYLKSLDKRKEEKKTAEVDSVLGDINSGMQRNKKFADLNKLEESVGMTPGDYNLKSNRDIALGAGAPKLSGDKRMDDFMSTFVEKPEENEFKAKTSKAPMAEGALRIGNRAGLIEDYRRPEMKDFVTKKLEEFKNKTGLDEDTYNGKLLAIEKGEGYNVSEYIDDYYKQGQKNKLRTDLEYDLIDPKAKGRAATTKAGETTDVKLRDEFQSLPEIKTVQNIASNFDKASKAYEQYLNGKSSPYEVDQQLGYFASKALDPNSVVMPGEFDRFAKGLGIVDGAQAMAEKLISGGLKLTDEQRKAMFNIVKNAWETAQEQGLQSYQYYNGQAKQNGQNPYNVTGKFDYIFDFKKDDNTKSAGTTPTPTKKYSDAAIKQAQAALNDPNAPEKVKAAARKVLGK